MKKSPNFVAGFILTFAILMITFSFYGYQIFFAPNFAFEKEDAYIFIPSNATFDTVLDSLEKNDLLHEKISFAFVSKILRYQDNIRPGKYKIPQKATNLQLVKKLKRGVQDPIKLTFNNIRTKEDLAEKLGAKIEPSPEEILALLNNKEYIKEFGFDEKTIVAMFIPNTYEVFWTISAKSLFERMQMEYSKFWNDERLEKAKNMNLSPIEVATLASIVEAETTKNSEKARIAGVYLNRLRIGMALQADPTVKFAVGDFAIKRILEVHLKTNSPYNTYLYPGLPPGPINLPSITSLDAVLNSEKHKYLYFCASPDLNGYHLFAENFEGHLKNANKYRIALNKLKIK